MHPANAKIPGEVAREENTVEIAHILFADIVSYSLLSTDQQPQVIEQLQQIIQSLPEFQKALSDERMICLPTGDGMALVFFADPTIPLRCARQISVALRDSPDLVVRIGVHTGPIYRVRDINGHWNVAGAGINIAQRVMDCGDGGHVLVTKSVADILSQLSGRRSMIQDLGEHTVKHGVRVHVFNVFDNEFGNEQLPRKLCPEPYRKSIRRVRHRRERSAEHRNRSELMRRVDYYRIRDTLGQPFYRSARLIRYGRYFRNS